MHIKIHIYLSYHAFVNLIHDFFVNLLCFDLKFSVTKHNMMVLSKLQFAGCVKNQYYTQTQYDEVRIEWSEFVYSFLE